MPQTLPPPQGYGFLSENATFVDICADHGIEFIGPRSDSIRLMGDKSTARDTMKARGGAPQSWMCAGRRLGCIRPCAGVGASSHQLAKTLAGFGLTDERFQDLLAAVGCECNASQPLRSQGLVRWADRHLLPTA